MDSPRTAVSTLVVILKLASLFVCAIPVVAFAPSLPYSHLLSSRGSSMSTAPTITWLSSSDDEDSIGDDPVVIVRPGDDIEDDLFEEMKEGQPSQVAVMKELLGIGGFTYALAACIAFFMGMNLIFGVGWLGNALGIPGTGMINEVSQSIPDQVDLNSADFSL